jgi:large subunit ribosomal protein L25
MAEIEKIVVQPRSEKGSTACRRLRAQGIVPANVYGHGIDPVPISLGGDTVHRVVRSGTHVVDLELGSDVQKMLLKDVQWDTFSAHVLHVDFQRIDQNERVTVEVPIRLRGTAPGVVAGGVLEQPLHMVEIECLAVEIPDDLEIRVSALQVGDVVHVSDLVNVPVGVTILSPPEAVLVSIIDPATLEQPEEEEAAAEEEAAEPALVGEEGEQEQGSEG